MAFIISISFIILLRIGELILSLNNEIWLLDNGAIEFGQKHYPYIVSLHVLFIVSMMIEYSTMHTVTFSLFFLVLYLLLLVFKTWIANQIIQKDCKIPIFSGSDCLIEIIWRRIKYNLTFTSYTKV
jgi:methyltransferase